MEASIQMANAQLTFKEEMTRYPPIALDLHIVFLVLVTVGSFVNYTANLRPWLLMTAKVRAAAYWLAG